VKRVDPRPRPDLPKFITGSGAQWVQPGTTAKGNILPPSYHVEYQGSWHPLEFVNGEWYWLKWDDNEYLGYWVKKASKIEQEHYKLGWGTREIEIKTPKCMIEISKAQERAESGSTQPSNQDSSSSGKDDPVDKNPVLTEKLAAIFEDNPVFEDITEATEPQGPRKDYMPAHMPTRGLGPLPINPIRVRATLTQEDKAVLTATKEAAKLITNKIKLDGGLKGRVPDSFNGDQTKAQSFMNAFDLFWMTNDDASMMTNPYK